MSLHPDADTLSRLGTLAQMVDQHSGSAEFDWPAARELLADRQLSRWLDGMHKAGLLATDPDEHELNLIDFHISQHDDAA
jgi:hypothetical protein